MKKLLVRLIALAVIGGGAFMGYKAIQQMPKETSALATAKVRKGDVVVRSFTRGELRAVRSTVLYAPNLFGTVQVTKLAPLGAFAREKDLVVEFDDSELIARVEEKQLELDQLDEQMKKSQAELAIRANQDQVELLTARYSVRRAELEVKRNELLSVIDQQKNKLTLEESRRRLKQLESDIKSRQEQAQAELAVMRERKNRANLEMSRERARLQQVKLLSPMSGLVAVRQNRGNFMMPGMQVPDIREGDQIQPGIPVADILDLSEMEVIAKVGELDRANLKEGQEAELMLDALPEKRLKAKIKSMSGTASANTFSFDPAKKFDVVFSVDMRELLGSLGAKADQISKIMATAEQNRRKHLSDPGLMAGGMGGMAGGMMMPGGGAGAFGGGGFNAGGGVPAGAAMQAGGQGGAPAGLAGMRMTPGGSGATGGAMADLSTEDQKKVREAMQKASGGKSVQDLSPEERQAVFAKMRDVMREIQKKSGGAERRAADGTAAAGTPDTGAGGERRRRSNADGTTGESGASAGDAASGGGARRGAAGGGGGGFGASQFSAAEMAAAKLPPPPEENSQFDVLLRPGLLADVQIIVEKIPNAVYVPTQAVVEREGKFYVFLKTEKGFDLREIKISKRSESVITIDSGVQPGEIIALSDPLAKPGAKKEKGSGGAMGALPGGKS